VAISCEIGKTISRLAEVMLDFTEGVCAVKSVIAVQGRKGQEMVMFHSRL
jgi:hypothetical protein